MHTIANYKLTLTTISVVLALTACQASPMSQQERTNRDLNIALITQNLTAQETSAQLAHDKKTYQYNSAQKRTMVGASSDLVKSANLSTAISASMTAPIIKQAASSNKRKVRKKGSHLSSMPRPPQNNEKYQNNERNEVHRTIEDSTATLSIDTDTGAYANVRRFLNDGSIPPKNAIRYEELINYFNYDFSTATRQKNAPFKIDLETVKAPWRSDNQIVKVAIKSIDTLSDSTSLPPANLVFLVDVSGSMNAKQKLALAKSSLKMLTKRLRSQDTISMITYAGNTEIVLPATSGKEKTKILSAIDALNAQGSTNGEAAIKLAYSQAQQHFKKDGINRILMMTDGDFNVGVSGVKEMLEIIKRGRNKGVSLSTFGFGTGNYNEYMMEQVANNGNGNYSYIDNVSEAKKVLIDEMSATFNTVAKDVKVQLEFNPSTVSEWRLIGYENRVLADQDFSNDKVDAGELGAGKSVVALFEITPVGKQGYLPNSRYQQSGKPQKNINELGFLKIRYKAPQGTTSKLLTLPIKKGVKTASSELKFALAVTGYGQLLKGSKYSGNWNYDDVSQYAKQGLGTDPLGSRHEFVKLVNVAKSLQ